MIYILMTFNTTRRSRIYRNLQTIKLKGNFQLRNSYTHNCNNKYLSIEEIYMIWYKELSISSLMHRVELRTEYAE